MPKTTTGQEVLPYMTWAQAVRDVLLGSINKGQFPWVVIGLIGLVAAFRMPPEALGRIGIQLVEDFHSLHVLGWILSVLFLAAWFFHARRQERMYNREIERLSEERNSYQADALGTLMKSSEAEQ